MYCAFHRFGGWTAIIILVVPSVTKCTYSPNRINSGHAICGTHETKIYKLQVK
ncbi:hypothetical protein PR003_g18272 [Phytophthora rubi]|uniref:Uncharacterized protein n=1 Tax=Phytophthora rubi TaxID=129364 RepID=A0A6A3K4J2_9STRA|nr:hypothetical protein PR002_g17593 [Phytophthora rubi]KAE9006091.1 hypothetical protein PR001_g17285 [Phytophthora rubi]KAE9318286.1 hypothetical protein PR003_g18272 [Phytophthora rubi]